MWYRTAASNELTEKSNSISVESHARRCHLCFGMGFHPQTQETLVQFLVQEVPLEKGLATDSSILGLPWWLRW